MHDRRHDFENLEATEFTANAFPKGHPRDQSQKRDTYIKLPTVGCSSDRKTKQLLHILETAIYC